MEFVLCRASEWDSSAVVQVDTLDELLALARQEGVPLILNLSSEMGIIHDADRDAGDSWTILAYDDYIE